MFTRIFEQINSTRLLIISFFILGSHGLVAYFFQIRYDGVIDLHVVESITWKEIGLDLIASWAILWGGLLLLGKRIHPRVRALDVWNAIGIARIPFVLLGLIQVFPQVGLYQAEMIALLQKGQLDLPGHLLLFVSIVALISLAATILFVILLFRGFKVATNLKSNKQIAWFFVTLLMCEIVAKGWLYIVN